MTTEPLITFVLCPPFGVNTWARERTYVTQEFTMQCFTIEQVKDLRESFAFLLKCADDFLSIQDKTHDIPKG